MADRLAHMTTPASRDGNSGARTSDPADIRWRSETRKSLVAARLRIGEPTRASWNAAIERNLEVALPGVAGRVIAFCWPFRGEPDVRGAVRRFISLGARAALPVVVGPKTPLVFRHWDESTILVSGAYGIPVPADSVDVLPDTLLLPANGFDGAGHRLGYGAGYFDRTIASLMPRPLVVGVAFELSRIPTARPQRHDIPVDLVVTEAGVFERRSDRLRARDT